MSISNINPNGAQPLGGHIGPRNDVNGQKQIPRFARDDNRVARDDNRVARDDNRVARDDKASAPTPAHAMRGAVTIAPPPGTDPALWSILTNAEREHFAASGARGPLTYGMASRGQLSTPAPATARGGRLDVKI